MNTSKDKDDIRLEVKTEVREEPWGRYVLVGVEATFFGVVDANDDIDDPIQRAILRGLDRIVVEVEKARLERTLGASVANPGEPGECVKYDGWSSGTLGRCYPDTQGS